MLLPYYRTIRYDSTEVRIRFLCATNVPTENVGDPDLIERYDDRMMPSMSAARQAWRTVSARPSATLSLRRQGVWGPYGGWGIGLGLDFGGPNDIPYPSLRRRASEV